MPLQKISLDSILGLNTQRNDSSGINPPAWESMADWALSYASSGATPPNTLQNCSNIIISRDKQAAARPPFVESWDFTSTYGSVNAFSITGMYAIPNSTTNSLQFSWVNGTTANIGNFSSSSAESMTCTIYLIAGASSAVFTSVPYLLPDFSWNYTTFPLNSFGLTRFLTSYSNIYTFSSNGVFRTSVNYIQNITNSVFNKSKRVTLPIVRSLSSQITASPAVANRWLSAGNLVDLQIVVTDQLSGTQVYQGKPSRLLTTHNFGTLSSIQVTFSVDNTNLFLNSAGVGIYRTIQYTANEAPPTTYYKCWESSLSTGATSSNVTTFTNIELILNDTSITQFQEIYTSLNVESVSSTTAVISAESAAPPTAVDVVQFNNFTVYGNVVVPPFASLTMTGLPNTDGNDKLQVGSTTISITYVPNSTTPPANTGVIDGTTGTFSGIASTPNTNHGYNLVIRPQDPFAVSSTASYSVPYYAVASTIALGTGTGSTYNVTITPKAGAIFNISQFPATGFLAIVGDVATGNVVALASYQSFTQNTAAGTYTFSDCLAFGVPFSDTTWSTTLPAGGSFPIYALNGTTITGLPVYAIGSDATGYSNQVGFSLLPTFELYASRPFNQTIVGVINSLNQAAAAGPLLAAINFIGVYSQTSAELLDQCTRTLCDTYNLARAAEDPYAVYVSSSTSPVGQIRYESLYSGYNRNSAYTNNASYTSGTGYYDQITARVFRVSGSPVVTFAEVTSNVLSNIMLQPVQTVAGISISKINKPEEIPIGQNLSPIIVGDPLKPIIKMVTLYNQLLIFKQNEGTYSANIQGAGAGILPSVSQLSLLDSSSWLLLPESVQVFEGNVYYFSNKAFVYITSAGQVAEVSLPIATELLEAYATIIRNGAASKVRSWVITQQRLYCCYFPNVNSDNTSSTYVFNYVSGQWTKWSGEINDAVVSAQGQLSLVENIYTSGQTISSSNDINNNSLDLSNKYWSVLRQANFQNPSTTQIEDTIPLTSFTIVANMTLNSITISNFNNSSVYGNLFKILMIFKNRTIWYLTASGGLYQAILSNAVSSTSITLQILNYDGTLLSALPFVPSINDFLITSVNIAMFFNKFFTVLPRGSTMAHYNEVQLYTNAGDSYSYLNLGFNSTVQVSNLIIDNLGNFVVDSSNNFVTLDTSLDSVFAPYYVLQSSQYVFRALVPLSAGRGRFIQIAILHDTPNEVFKLNSVTYIFRDTTSTKVKAHS